MRTRTKALLAIEAVAALAIAIWLVWGRQRPAAAPSTSPPMVVRGAAPAPAVQPPTPPGVPNAALPEAPTGTVELHGTLRGARFWVRLHPPVDGGEARQLELVYTPPTPEALGGSVLHDSPYLQVDGHLAIIAWDLRDGLSGIKPTKAPAGYKVMREMVVGDDHAVKSRSILGERGWDLHVAPVLLALGWRDGTSAEVRLVDFYGPRGLDPLVVRWSPGELAVAGERWQAEPDVDGRLLRLRDAAGSDILVVAGRK